MFSKGLHPPSLDNSLLILGTNRKDFEQPGSHENEVLVALLLQDFDEVVGPSTLQDNRLSNLKKGEDLKKIYSKFPVETC